MHAALSSMIFLGFFGARGLGRTEALRQRGIS